MAKFSKKTYELVAEEIAAQAFNNGHPDVMITLANLANHFANQFEKDNVMFDRKRFLKACGV